MSGDTNRDDTASQLEEIAARMERLGPAPRRLPPQVSSSSGLQAQLERVQAELAEVRTELRAAQEGMERATRSYLVGDAAQSDRRDRRDALGMALEVLRVRGAENDSSERSRGVRLSDMTDDDLLALAGRMYAFVVGEAVQEKADAAG